MTRDAEMSATDFVAPRARQHRRRDRRRGASPGSRRTPRSRSTPSARRAPGACAPSGSRACASCCSTAEPGSDHQLTFARSYAAAAHSDAGARRPRGPARRHPGRRRPRGRPGPALGARHRPRRSGSRRRGPDRGRARARQHDRRQGERRRRPGRAAHRRGQGRGAGSDPIDPRHAQRDPPQRGLSSSASGRTTCWRRTSRSTSRPPTPVSTPSASTGLRRAGVHLPAGAGSPGLARARRRLAGRQHRAKPAPPSATSARAAPTSPAPSPRRPRTHLALTQPSRRSTRTGRRLQSRSSVLLGVQGLAARAWSASIWMPRLRPPTRSPAANVDCICSVVSSTSWSVMLRRTSPPVTISRTRAAGSSMIRMLRDGATRELCSCVAKARGSPRGAADEDAELEARDLLGRADRLVDLEPLGAVELTNGHLLHRPSTRRCPAPAARRCPCWAAEPLVLGRLAAGREPSRP